ncbi:hypothetical protein PCE1_004532 [Barthelona sp. PCE]
MSDLVSLDTNLVHFSSFEKNSHAKVTLTSNCDNAVLFKFKTNKPKRYGVQEPVGVIGPRETKVLKVAVTENNLNVDTDISGDRFLILHMDLKDVDPEIDPFSREIWTIYGENVNSTTPLRLSFDATAAPMQRNRSTSALSPAAFRRAVSPGKLIRPPTTDRNDGETVKLLAIKASLESRIKELEEVNHELRESSEIMRKQVSSLKRTVDDCRSETEDIKITLNNKLKEMDESATADRKELNDEITELRQKKEQNDIEIQTTTRELNEARESMRLMKNLKGNLETEVSELKIKIETLNGELDTQHKMFDDYKNVNTDEIKELNKTIDDLRADKTEDEMAVTIDSLSQQVKTLNREISEYERDINTKEAEYTVLHGELERKNSELGKMEESVIDTEFQLNSTKKLLDDSTLEVDRLNDVVKEKEVAIEEIQTAVAEKNAEIINLKQKNDEAVLDLGRLQTTVEERGLLLKESGETLETKVTEIKELKTAIEVLEKNSGNITIESIIDQPLWFIVIFILGLIFGLVGFSIGVPQKDE